MPTTYKSEYPPLGVLDIGSNTVRLVLFRRTSTHLSPEWANWQEVFNVREPCALGEGLALTGAMKPANLAHAVRAIRSFRRALAAEAPDAYIDVLATAAVRDADNAERLIHAVAKAFGSPPRVLSGEEEARYATLGVIYGKQDAEGLFADLGGGSLELGLSEHGPLMSLPIGVVRLREKAEGKRGKARKTIIKALKPVGFLKRARGETLHLVGGSWRHFAALHRMLQNEPLPDLIEGYSLRAGKARSFANKVAREKPSRLAPYLRRPDRARTLPFAALVLRRLIRQSGVRRVRFSQYGIREGLLVDWLRSGGYRKPADDRQFTLNLEDPERSATEGVGVGVEPGLKR